LYSAGDQEKEEKIATAFRDQVTVDVVNQVGILHQKPHLHMAGLINWEDAHPATAGDKV
jgi:hypothetical protein